MSAVQSVVWVVGASTGIGRSLALHYAKAGGLEHIIVSARSADKLATLKAEVETLGTKCLVVPLDMSDAESLAAAETVIAEQIGKVSTVVINAGTCEYMDSNSVDVAMARRVFETNYFGALEISRMSLPFLRSARDAGDTPAMVFVSSSVTYQALPRAHAYGASKAALRYFAECLRADLQLENINVQIVSPGFVETPLTEQNDFDMPFIVTSDEAAQKIAKGIAKGSFDIAFPKPFIWSLKTLALLPVKLRFALLGKMSRHESKPVSSLKGSSQA